MTDQPRLGVYRNLDDELYHKDKALGSSNIRKLFHSVQEFDYDRNNSAPKKRNSNLILGQAIHKLILEGVDAFLQSYNVSKTTLKVIKEEGFYKVTNGSIKLSRTEYDTLKTWYKILHANPVSKKYLDMIPHKNVETELSYFWEEDGVRFKCRFDMLINNRVNVDLKTTKKIDGAFDAALTKVVMNYGYDMQAKHYLNGLNHMNKELGIFPKSPPISTNLFIEKSGPYRVATKTIKECLKENAQARIDEAIRKYKIATETGCWIDPVQENITLEDIPSYMYI